jgi:hypothetical protein
MRRMLNGLVVSIALLGAADAAELRIAAVERGPAAAWDARIQALLREGALLSGPSHADRLVPGRLHQRFPQSHRGVPVWGGELVRQTDAAGAVSVFGTLYDGIALEVTPRLTPDQARAVAEAVSGVRLPSSRQPELLVLPLPEGGYALAYRVRVLTEADLVQYFIDALDGKLVFQYSDLQRQAAVGLGTGVHGDRKKLSASRIANGFAADDKLRPPALYTYDLRGDLGRVLFFLNGFFDLGASTPATSTTTTSSASAGGGWTTPTSRSAASCTRCCGGRNRSTPT